MSSADLGDQIIDRWTASRGPLFTDMYEVPDRVKALADWCADWSIAIEDLLKII